MDQHRGRGLGQGLTKVGTAMGLGGSAVVAPQAVLALALGLVGLGLVVVLALVLLLFCERAFERLLELVREVRGEPSEPRTTLP